MLPRLQAVGSGSRWTFASGVRKSDIASRTGRPIGWRAIVAVTHIISIYLTCARDKSGMTARKKTASTDFIIKKVNAKMRGQHYYAGFF